MLVSVTIGVTNPAAVDLNSVAKAFPYGKVTVNATEGGLEVPNEAGDDGIVIANAAVIVSFDERC